MPFDAPLRVTVEIRFEDGPVSGQRLFRLSHTIALPPRLYFARGLPIEGEVKGMVTFVLPDAGEIQSAAILHYDPNRPEAGSEAELPNLTKENLQLIQNYIERYPG